MTSRWVSISDLATTPAVIHTHLVQLIRFGIR